MKKHPFRNFAILTFGPCLGLAAWLWLYVRIPDPLFSWLIAVTVATFLVYGYDKAIAGKDWTRVPERNLLALALAGGTLGALAGMRLFRHKTIKKSFRLKFWAVVCVQVIGVALYVYYLRPPLF